MAQPFDIALPPDILLSGGYTVRVTAIDPTTGNTVAGVNVSDVTLQVEDLGGSGAAALQTGPFMLVMGPNV